MAFKPANAKSTNFTPSTEVRKYPVPRKGSRPARISMLVELGIQEREDDDNGNPRKPCQQVALFADLVKDVVDYGGSIGNQPYRMMLNKSFKGELQGINFVATPPKDADGNLISGGKWGFHPASILTKLAKAVGREDVITSMDAEQLLDQPVRINVIIKETPDKNGKKDDKGEPVVYTNVNFGGFASLIEDDDGVLETVPQLPNGFRCITFDNAKAEDIAWVRRDVIKKIKQATNYEGSQIQKAIAEFEALQQQAQEQKPEAPKAEAKESEPTKVPKAAKPKFDDFEDDIPFN